MATSDQGSLLSRYRAGEREAVWADLTALGGKVREAPYAEDAWEVARETMRRARHNIELIIRRLDQLDYQFWDGKQGTQKKTATTVVFAGKTINAWPIEARLASMFDEAIKMSPTQFTLAMLRDLHAAYQLAMLPWQDRALLKGKRLPLDAEVTTLFERTKRTPTELTETLINHLNVLYGQALEQARDYWKEKGEEPPAIREQREKERRRTSEKKGNDHLSDKKVFCPPAKTDTALIRKLENKGVFLPLALCAWMEEVGDVNLAGSHAHLCLWDDGDLPVTHADPLMVTPRLFIFEIEDWIATRKTDETLSVLVGWDARAKARLTVDDKELDYGYTIEIPNGAADGPLRGTPHDSFVGYLRNAFRWGGFPGWGQYQKRPEKDLAILTENLLPI